MGGAKRAAFWLAGVAAAALAGAAHAAPSLGEPSLSPDGREVAFVSGGDIWTAPVGGGDGRILVSDPATESRPLWSPDGKRLAFLSNRAGSTNVYLLTLATGQVTRLTWSDSVEQLDGWSHDGRWIYFNTGVNDVGAEGDVFRVSAEGGTPLEVSADMFLSEFQSAPSPDGTQIALMTGGISDNQWWRNGHSHIDETELWLRPVSGAGAPRRLLPEGAKHAFPMWTPDGARLFYMSDESGAENIWSLPVAGGAPTQVTRFTDGRVLWPTIAWDGRAIVFERDFQVWRLDLATGQAAPIPVALRGAPAGAGERRLRETGFRSLALSPDGKKVAVIAHGEVFAAPAKDGGPAQRLTRTAGAESDLAWSSDSRRLFYVTERGLDTRLAVYDFATARETVLTASDGLIQFPVAAPDGRSVAYQRNGKELHVLALTPAGGPGADRVLFTGVLDEFTAPNAWSPDGRWLAFLATDRKSFRNVHVVPAAGGEARPISFLANGDGGNLIAWSPDGAYIVFDTAQRSEQVKLVRVDLLPHVPKYREDAFRDLFKPGDTPDAPSKTLAPDRAPRTAPPAKEAPVDSADKPAPDAQAKADKEDAKSRKPKAPAKPVRIVFDGIRERATLLPLGMDAEGPAISPDGETLVFASHQGERWNLYKYGLDELALEPPAPEQLTSTEKPKTDYGFTADSKTVFYLDGDRIFSTPLETPKPKALAVNAEMEVDFDTEKRVVFDEAWGLLNRRFYDPQFHGKDWAALRTRFAPQVEGARTGDEVRRLANLMIGELNASHSGMGRPRSGGGGPASAPVGDLGLRFDRVAYEAGQGLKVREVIRLGPADIEGSLRPGETLLEVDGEVLGPHANLDRMLVGKVGRRTVLRVRSAAGAVREVVVRPVNVTTADGLHYRQWVNERRAYVERASGGRLGYVHILDMTEDSLNQLYLDLDAQNQGRQGVVIDVRNNHGGFVNGYALDVFTRRNYLTMTPRGQPSVPSRQALGQRSLGLPTVLVTNESSLSDAEDFTEGYRTLGLGKVVGKPTAGWIIYTGGRQLIDGSTVRLPFIKVEDGRGQNMELNPRPVDVRVDRPLGETAAGRDAQLDAAVKVLLGG